MRELAKAALEELEPPLDLGVHRLLLRLRLIVLPPKERRVQGAEGAERAEQPGTEDRAPDGAEAVPAPDGSDDPRTPEAQSAHRPDRGGDGTRQEDDADRREHDPEADEDVHEHRECKVDALGDFRLFIRHI